MRLGTGLATAKLGGTAVASIRRGANTVYDADATTYLKAVEAADGQGLEPAVAKAIQDFVVGLKATSAGVAADPTRTLWDAVQASCIMCGARTIAGALVPLKGTAPTPNNFVSDDYNRSTGLSDPDATSWLDSNRANDADGQNDNHLSAYATVASTTGSYLIGSNDGGSVHSLAGVGYWCRTSSGETGVAPSVGLHAITRSDGSGFKYMKASGSVLSSSKPSAAITAQRNTFVFGYSIPTPAGVTDARLAFYSIGSALDLAALDTKVTALVAAVSAALA